MEVVQVAVLEPTGRTILPRYAEGLWTNPRRLSEAAPDGSRLCGIDPRISELSTVVKLPRPQPEPPPQEEE